MNVILSKTKQQQQPVIKSNTVSQLKKLLVLNFISLKHHFLMLCDKTHG